MENSNWENDDKILDFLDGYLSPEEQLEFEAEKANNDSIKEKLALYTDCKQAIMLNGRKELSEKLKTIESKINFNTESTQTKTKTIIMNTEKRKRSPFIGIAAGLVLVLGAFFFMQQNAQPNPEALYAEYNKNDASTITNDHLDKIGSSGFASTDSDSTGNVTIPGGPTLTQEEYMQRETVRKESLTEALTLYKKSSYAKARVALFAYTSEYVFNKEDRQIALFHLAKTLMNTEDYKGASEKYDEFLSGEKLDGEIMDVAEFDRAIVWLQLNPGESKKYLKDISMNMAHTYQSSAKGLYDSL